MTIDRLPEALQTLYAELLDQAVQAEAEEAALRLPPPGTFVRKKVHRGIYWYLQRSEGGGKRQVYLGPESPELVRWIDEVRARRREQRPDDERRAALVAMLHSGGASRMSAVVGRVLRLLAESGVFRLGGVLVGTYAYAAYENMLGVRLAAREVRTEDVDVTQERSLAIALDPEAVPVDVERALQQADPRFLAVPALDSRRPSTSFKLRGQDLRVDLLTPQHGREEGPVPLPLLKAAAQPLPFLGYLLSSPQAAVVLPAGGVLVRIPEPARFALHKLWLSIERPAAQQGKAAKDLRQASRILEVLLTDRPHDLPAAWRAIDPPRRHTVRQAIARLDPRLAERLLASLGD
ncbi:MAG TPA: GSU2403 family nucleotidyltransferase fold protein [Thermoanaerobaculia bacterium]|nr:GSU2403 family nucleotidyltransferase fold protein [Thermoanaerobaculia bacterium]